MGSEFGPEHDHNMDATSMQQQQQQQQQQLKSDVTKFVLFLEYFAVATLATNLTAWETHLESPSQKFEEGLPRCFQFWYMIEVCIAKKNYLLKILSSE